MPEILQLYLVFRFYGAKPEILEGKSVPPPVKRIN